MRALAKLIGALPLLIFSGTTQAAPVLIDFDSLADTTLVGSTFSGLGVTFTDAVVSAQSLTGESLPNTIASLTSDFQPQPSDPILAAFSMAVSTVSLRGLDVGENGFVLSAYDAVAGGNLLDTQQVIGIGLGTGSFFDLTVNGSDIRRVEFSQVQNVTSDGIAFDNFLFEQADQTVPEPATLLLLGTGLFGLGLMRWRKAA